MRVRRLLPALLLAAVTTTALAAPAFGAHAYRYPLRGAHNYGDLAVTGFGVKRSDGSHHLGQDIIADCGTPILAAHDGVVKSAGYSTGYGYYVVVGGKGTRFDFVYGHMKGRSWKRVNKKVHAGQRLGSVGRTGTDSGVCHLHFELWKGRWFAGGSRTNPLPHLRAWDKYSGGPYRPDPVPVGQDSASKRLFYDAAE
ncbi:MAG TPA: M23 family metallopeptidase [Solirubrobacterales bacterium]|jgi:murein DD-endopeptidase MepM/ murein hydrolase activator NlpD